MDIYGTLGNDTLDGTAGSDTIILNGGADTVHAGDGDDLIVVNAPTGPAPFGTGSLLDGGTGFDTLVLKPQAGLPSALGSIVTPYILTQASLTGIEGVRFDTTVTDVIYLAVLDQQLTANGMTNLTGGAGRDILVDVVFAPGTYVMPNFSFTNWTSNILDPTSDYVSLFVTGNSTASFTLIAREGLASTQALSGGLGNDILIGSSGSEFLTATRGVDQLYGNGGTDILIAENLAPYGGSASTFNFAGDIFDGGDGIDVLEIGGSVNLTAATITNIERLYLEPAFVAPAPGSNSIPPSYLTITAAQATSGFAADTLLVGAGIVEIQVGAGQSLNVSGWHLGTNSTVTVSITGTSGNETITGTGGDDVINGRGGVDVIHAGAGDDAIVIDKQLGFNSVLDGGDGFDTLVLKTQPGIPSALGGTITQYSLYSPTVLTSLEAVTYVSQAGDVLSLVVLDSQRASAGLTTLIGGAGRDLFYDVVFQPGTYTMPDLTYINWNSDLSSVNCDFVVLFASSAGNYTLNAREGVSVLQALVGNVGDDVLNGSSGRDLLNGKGGINQLYGNGGDDLLYAENLRPFGGSASTLTFAGSIYDGGSGSDTLVIGGSVNFQGTLVSIEKIFFEPAAPSPGPGVDGFDPARLTLSGSNALTLAGNANIGGTGTFVINLDAASSTIDISGWQFAGAAPINFFGNGDDKTIQIYGTGNDDLIRDADSGDVLWGNGGNDTIYGNGGDDAIRGGAGADTLYGGAGNDTIYGGFTRDIVQPQSGDLGDTIDGGAGNDRIRGGDGDDFLFGGADDDNLRGDAGNDTIDGGDGFDQVGYNFSNMATSVTLDASAIHAGADVQSMYDGQGGTDLLSNVEMVSLSGSQAGDLLLGSSTLVNELIGNGGDDVIRGGNNNDFIDGGDGDDLIEGRAGNDTIDGGAGSDTASYANASGAVTVDLVGGTASGADGNDTLISIENVIGSAFNDTLLGSFGANTLDGGTGDDGLYGFSGNDALLGGDGNDFLRAGNGDDTVNGGAGYDRAGYYQTNAALGGVTVSLLLQGSAQYVGSQGWDTLIGIENVSGTPFADTLTGDAGDNWLWGSTSWLGGVQVATNNDVIDGGGGNDLIQIGGGNHTLTGGSGSDTVLYGENGDAEVGLTISLALQGGAQTTGAGSWTLNGFENLSGGKGNDQLTGDASANVLAGGDGNDTLVGGGGNDSLYGDGSYGLTGTGGSGSIILLTDANLANGAVGGNDTLEGGLGNDLINGGVGSDTASYANAAGAVIVDLNAGTASGADGNDTFVSIENAIGSQFGDELYGSAGDNVLQGLGGDDYIQGGNGNDTVYGGDGNDFLLGDIGENFIGYGGNDVLYGENGNDILRGGLGNDQLFGGANNDLLRGNGGIDYFDGGSDDGEGINGIGDRVSFYDRRATQGAVADLRTGIISNDGFGNVETMVNIESLGSDTAYADSFYGDDNRNFISGSRGDNLYGFSGDDLFQSSSAPAVLDGGAGIDLVNLYTEGGWLMPDANGDGLAEVAAAASAGWAVNLAAGTMVDGYGNSGTIVGIENVNGSALGDTLIGDANANVFNGLDGDDLIEGRGGNDTIDGGNGIDTASYANASGSVTVNLSAGLASGADGNDTLLNIENVIGSAFNDSLSGNAGNNIIDAGDGHDFLAGNAGNDSLVGGSGDDVLFGGAGDDRLDGGAGFDRVGYSDAAAGVTVNLNLQGVAQNTGGGGIDTLVGIENVSGTQFNDTLVGDGFGNWLWGGTGNDTISAGAGNDLVEVGTGSHTLNGGTGIDTLSLWGHATDISAAGVIFSLALQGAAQNTLQGMMNATGFENVSGSRYNDTLTGDAGANILLGDTGNDTLNGGDGNDTLYGDGRISVDDHGTGFSGPITLFGDVMRDQNLGTGADGNDILNGGKGDDTLYGGRGNDIMSGGPGADRFIIEAQSGADRITDFAHVDRVVFDAFAGPHAFKDLILTAVGKDVMITWGTGDSLVIEGYRPRDLTAADFNFTPAAAPLAATSFATVDSSTATVGYLGNDFASSHLAVDMMGHLQIIG